MLFQRLLKVGGRLDILTPDLALILGRYRGRQPNWPWAMQCLYGLQTYDQNYHRSLYDYPTLSTQITSLGFLCEHLPNVGNLLHLMAVKQ